MCTHFANRISSARDQETRLSGPSQWFFSPHYSKRISVSSLENDYASVRLCYPSPPIPPVFLTGL